MNHLIATLALTSLLFAVPTAANAQESMATAVSATARVGNPTMTVGPNTLTRGGTAEITYTDASKAGQTITVTIDNGMRRAPESVSIEIVLDENGQGSASWTVPDTWFGANFNAPGVTEISRPIQ